MQAWQVSWPFKDPFVIHLSKTVQRHVDEATRESTPLLILGSTHPDGLAKCSPVRCPTPL
jgi:hypothetical protein